VKFDREKMADRLLENLVETVTQWAVGDWDSLREYLASVERFDKLDDDALVSAYEAQFGDEVEGRPAKAEAAPLVCCLCGDEDDDDSSKIDEAEDRADDRAATGGDPSESVRFSGRGEGERGASDRPTSTARIPRPRSG